MKIVIAANGDGWDSLAYKYLGDEFQCDHLMAANSRAYSSVVLFEGGEKVVIPEALRAQSKVVKAPWED